MDEVKVQFVFPSKLNEQLEWLPTVNQGLGMPQCIHMCVCACIYIYMGVYTYFRKFTMFA